MGRHDWYRGRTWSKTDEAEFYARLKRSRGDRNKSQYLRIQASYLAEAGLHAQAIRLLDDLLKNYPSPHELSMARLQRARAFSALNLKEEALSDFRLSIAAQRDIPNVRTNCWLDLPWFIVKNRRVDLYPEALSTLDEFADKIELMFAISRYQFATVRALIHADRGEIIMAREFAELALKVATIDSSGFRYHPDVGLVKEVDPEIHDRLLALVGRNQ